MECLHLIPGWFVGLNILLKIILLIFTGVIAYYSLKIYRLSNQKELKFFGLAFSFLSISYFITVWINIFFLSIAGSNIRALDIDDIIGIKNLAVALYILFYMLSFITLFYITLKSKNLKIYALLIFLSIIAITFSYDKSLMLYLIPSIFLILVTYYYITQYLASKNKNTLLVSIAMAVLLVSNLCMISIPNCILPSRYVFSAFLEIIAYSLIVFSLFKILKNGKKTR